jgi:hypothetical protein
LVLPFPNLGVLTGTSHFIAVETLCFRAASVQQF